MEGLFIARIVEELRALLPARNLGWVFPDESTAALLIEPRSGRPLNLALSYRPPTPALYLNRERLSGEPNLPFQRTLASRARGSLTDVSQLKLDRVVRFVFADAEGFRPAPAAVLVFELTGRNTNLLLTEPGEEEGEPGIIIQAARDVTTSRNRFRQVRAGLPYTPPPPYEKLDPRIAPSEALEQAVSGLAISSWHKRVDGLGPLLSAEVAARAGVQLDTPVLSESLAPAIDALRSVAADPSLTAGGASLSEQARERSGEERLSELRKAVRPALEKRRTLLERQLGDVDRARENAFLALGDREVADTLLALAHEVPSGVASVTLPNVHDGIEVEIELDPTLDAPGNANRIYARARRREDVLARLEEREPALRQALTEARATLERLDGMGLSELESLIDPPEDKARAVVGMRYRTRGGFEVLVGRNDRENDVLTHKVARSADLWLHAQGYPGSHVVLRSAGRQVPFEDVLEAAAIAAHHSRARGSVNVPVDYTLAKNVWRPKGGKAGAVNYSDQKTVFVDAEVARQ